MEKVSVIIPIFNRAGVFSKTLESVLNQSYRNIEVLVIDDNSDDIVELECLLDEFRDTRVALYKNMKNMNAAYSRNAGIKKATGSYIAFMDSDDVWAEDKIEKQIRLAETLNEKFVITCLSRVVRQRFVEILPILPIGGGQSVADFLFTHDGYIPTPSIFLPTGVARKNLFNEKLRRHQDYDFLLRIQRLGVRFHTINEPLLTVYANHTEKSERRGGGYAVSEAFLKDYSEYFDVASKNYFWLKNIGYYKSRAGEKWSAIKEMITEKRFIKVKLKDIIIFSSYYIIVNTPFYEILEWLYSLTRNKAVYVIGSKKH